MNKFKTFKEMLEERVVKIAKDLAWDSFSSEQKESFLNQAKIKSDEESAKLALKCWEDSKVMEDPDYVSRADPRVYRKKD